MKGSVSWTLRSPDLTVLNFFFWSFVKNCAYVSKKTLKLADFKEIRKVVPYGITRDMLQGVW